MFPPRNYKRPSMVGRHPIRPARTARAFHPTVSSPLQAPPLAGARRSKLRPRGGFKLVPPEGAKKKGGWPRRQTRGGGGGVWVGTSPKQSSAGSKNACEASAHSFFKVRAARVSLFSETASVAMKRKILRNAAPCEPLGAQ